MQTPRNILILRFSSIGDIVLTTPVVRAIKMRWPEADVHFATKKAYEGLLIHNPYIDHVHVLEDSLTKLLKELSVFSFDYIVDLHNNLRTSLIKKWFWRVPSKSFPKLNFEKWLLVNLKIQKLPNIHIVERYASAAKALDISLDEEGLDYFIPSKDEFEDAWLPPTHQKGYVAYAMGGQHATKKLPYEKMIELCARINKPIILLGGKEDLEDANKIEAFFSREGALPSEERSLNIMNKNTVIFNAVGRLNLNQSAHLLKNAKVVFAHDTGLMHIAAAFKKKIFSIWGNTTPLFGMYPYMTSFVVLEHHTMPCRPCSKIGYSKCPKGHFACMKELTLDFYLPEEL